MGKVIYGLRTVARKLGVGVDRIRRLINLKKIKPKKAGSYPQAPWMFDEEDQKKIRESTSMHE